MIRKAYGAARRDAPSSPDTSGNDQGEDPAVRTAARPPDLLAVPGELSPAATAESLFTGMPRLVVQTPVEAHDTKKTSGSSDGAQTYDTPIT